jgi:hypothetical protein
MQLFIRLIPILFILPTPLITNEAESIKGVAMGDNLEPETAA